MNIEEDKPRKAPTFSVGQDLTSLSTTEIEEIIGVLQAEIARLGDALASKSRTRSAADALFKF